MNWLNVAGSPYPPCSKCCVFRTWVLKVRKKVEEKVHR